MTDQRLRYPQESRMTWRVHEARPRSLIGCRSGRQGPPIPRPRPATDDCVEGGAEDEEPPGWRKNVTRISEEGDDDR